MKKFLTISAILLVAVLALGVAGFAYAQTQNPPDSSVPYGYGQMGPGMGSGMMGGKGGGFGRGMMGAQAGAYGPMHTYMVNAFAAALDLTPEALQAELDAGKTMWALAEAHGYTAEQFTELMLQTRSQALEAMVADGAITQEQAEWMLQRMDQMQQNGFGPGNCPMHGGAGGPGRGPARWNPGT
jgi:hypothetical protein